MRVVYVALWAVVWANSAAGAIIVDPPQPLARRVTVQLIQTALDSGSSPATVFGNATQRANIEASIDSIWAQAGIDIAILPTVNRYNDTFAYQGNAGSGTRPGGDLGRIFDNARSEGGILNPDPLVLNLVFANVVPAFAPLSENTAAGYARVGGNGIVGFVGDNLLTFQNGRDVIASVMAHEIGHNLGLSHTASGLANLMSPSGSTEQLNSSQIATARSSSFAQSIPVVVEGDYNGNGTVDAADYVVWRKQFGTPAGYDEWRANFGDPVGTGGATGLSREPLAAVPEPLSTTLALIAIVSVLGSIRRTTRR